MTAKDDRNTFDRENTDSVNPPQTTFADLGIPTEHQTRITIIGAARTCSSLTKWEWLYLTVSVTSLLMSLILTIYTMSTLGKSVSRFDFTFALVLIYTTLFCFYYVIHGILKERPYELMVFAITIFIILGYSIMNYLENSNNLKLVRLILVCILGPILIISGIWLSREYYLSGNLVYRTVGANINLQYMCKMMFLCSTLLKFDLQLQGSMLLLVLKQGISANTRELIILGIGLSITVIFVAIGFLSMRFENKILVIVFLILSISEPAYIIYIFYESRNLEEILYRVIYLCGVAGLLVWISSVVCMYYVMKNFGKGLKEKVYGDTPNILDPEISLPPNDTENVEKEKS